MDAEKVTEIGNAAVRAETLMKRMARGCVGCGVRSVKRCEVCVCATAADVLKDLETGRYRLGLVDIDTGRLESRDPGKSARDAKERARKRRRKERTSTEAA